MMKIIFREGARADLRNIMARFHEMNDGSAARFEAVFEAELIHLVRHPKGYQVRRPPYRFALVGRFKYVIIYVVEGDSMVLHRIRHTHRRPLKRYAGE